MNEFDDRILIHTATLVPESRSHARVYNYAFHFFKINTPTPRTSYASSITSYVDPSTPYTTPRTSHRIPKQRHRIYIYPLRYKVEEIPSYVSKSNQNQEQL